MEAEERKGKKMMEKKEARLAWKTRRATVREHDGILTRLEGNLHLDPRGEAIFTALFAAVGLAIVLIGAAL